jgi:hypothetical protein
MWVFAGRKVYVSFGGACVRPMVLQKRFRSGYYDSSFFFSGVAWRYLPMSMVMSL